MTSCSLSLSYTLVDRPGAGTLRPCFTVEPEAGNAHQVRFCATNLRSVDRLDVKWSSVETMKEDPVKAYLSKIGTKGGTVGGKAKTDAKAEAARANGKRGGRPVGAKDSKPRTRRAKP